MITEKDFSQIAVMWEYLRQVPFDVTRRKLYSAQELYMGYDPNVEGSFESCYDSQVYHHYVAAGKQQANSMETLAQTLHDHGIHTGLDEFFKNHDQRLSVGIMGGHAQLRTDPSYRDIVFLSKRLTEKVFCMPSGGGPGAMEATHLGAWMAGRSTSDVNDALKYMSVAPSLKDSRWLSQPHGVHGKEILDGGYAGVSSAQVISCNGQISEPHPLHQ